MRVHVIGVLGLLMLASGLGCHSAPKGDDRGRMDPGATDPTEKHAPGMVTADLRAAADKVAQELLADVQRLMREEFSKTTYRITLVWGDVDNSTSTMRSSDLEFVCDLMKNKLMKSDIWTNSFAFADMKRKIDRKNRREGVGQQQEDVLERGTGDSDGVPRDPEHLAYLDVKLSGVARGEVEDYSLSFYITTPDGIQRGVGSYDMKYKKNYRR